MTTRLITIAFSHYCEKARWALDRAGIVFEEDTSELVQSVKWL